MGILNVTPDSFSDGGRYRTPAAALDHARRMVAEGAAIIDVGGESTRPGARGISVQQEIDRVIPVIERLHAELAVAISVDTSKPEVMREACAAGAGMINDVYALRAEGALEMAAGLGVPVCLMHMQGTPRTMQQCPIYEDVVAEVEAFLVQRMADCVRTGIPRQQLVVDPGFGFGKTVEHNLRLFGHLDRFARLGAALLVGVSRKSLIGDVLGAPVEQRLHGGVALAALAAWQGAVLIRTHDVGPTREALDLCAAIQEID